MATNKMDSTKQNGFNEMSTTAIVIAGQRSVSLAITAAIGIAEVKHAAIGIAGLRSESQVHDDELDSDLHRWECAEQMCNCCVFVCIHAPKIDYGKPQQMHGYN